MKVNDLLSQASAPTPSPLASAPMWSGKPLVHADHAPDLDRAAAVYEMGADKLPRAAAEDRAHADYKKRQHIEAAAHHLGGMKAAVATGDIEAARKHGVMYELHSKALGHDTVGPAHPEVAARLARAPLGFQRFKAHRGDLFAVPEKKEEAVTKAEILHGLYKALKKMAPVGPTKPTEPEFQDEDYEYEYPTRRYDYSAHLPPEYRSAGHRLVAEVSQDADGPDENGAHPHFHAMNYYTPSKQPGAYMDLKGQLGGTGHHDAKFSAGGLTPPASLHGAMKTAFANHMSLFGQGALDSLHKGEPDPHGEHFQLKHTSESGKSFTHPVRHKTEKTAKYHAAEFARKRGGSVDVVDTRSDKVVSSHGAVKKGEMSAKPRVVPCVCKAYPWGPHRAGGGKCKAGR